MDITIFLMGALTVSMAIFNSFVKSPDDNIAIAHEIANI